MNDLHCIKPDSDEDVTISGKPAALFLDNLNFVSPIRLYFGNVAQFILNLVSHLVIPGLKGVHSVSNTASFHYHCHRTNQLPFDIDILCTGCTSI
jgi:hypothetical protein